MPYDRASSLPILGLPVRFEASDGALLDAALAGYAPWRGVPLSPPDAPGVRLRIGWLGADLSRPDTIVEPTIAVSGSRIRVSAPGLEGTADHVTGEASCRVAGWLAADPQRLATDLLDTLLLFMLTRLDRVPLHAAGIVRNGVAALLCAPSGVGKSTLALAAVQHGFKLLSDDAVYLESLNDNGVRVWGWPRAVYVAPSSDAARPGVAAQSAAGGGGGVPLRLRNGKWKEAHALPGAWAAPPVAERAVIMLLERGSGRALARSIDQESASDRLLGTVDAGFDVWRSALAPALSQIAATRAWQVTTSSDPAETLAVLSDMTDNPNPQSSAAAVREDVERPAA